MTTKTIRARLLVAVIAIAACLALAPVTARAAQASSWSVTTLAAFGGFPSPGEGGQQGAGAEGMPAAPGAESTQEGEAAVEEEPESGSAIDELKDTLRQYRDYAEIHPVRVYGSIAALLIGLIFAFAYRKRA